MSKIGLFNMLLGFFFIFIASCCGAFLANDSAYALLQNKDMLQSWQYVLRKSAHAHTNFFGILHILFGLTVPYSQLASVIKVLQTIGFFCGSFAMSFLLLVRSNIPVSPQENDYLGWIVGLFLAFSLLALAVHCFALFAKLCKSPF